VASSLAHQPSTSSGTSSAALSPSSSHDSDINSPATSVQPSITNGHIPTLAADVELAQQLQDRTKQMEEQEAIIKTLNKQLTHCEADLQSHMDMVNNLETSLGDSEKNRMCFILHRPCLSYLCFQSEKLACKLQNLLVSETASTAR
jgi:kinesin family protein 4/21/27